LGKVRRTLRGSRGSLTSFHRSSQRSGAWQPCLQASTGCLQGILQEARDFYRKSANFYRMFCNLGDGWVNELYGWMGRMRGELVMAYGQRDEMERGCVKLVGR
jgi:hypothetical protein